MLLTDKSIANILDLRTKRCLTATLSENAPIRAISINAHPQKSMGFGKW